MIFQNLMGIPEFDRPWTIFNAQIGFRAQKDLVVKLAQRVLAAEPTLLSTLESLGEKSQKFARRRNLLVHGSWIAPQYFSFENGLAPEITELRIGPDGIALMMREPSAYQRADFCPRYGMKLEHIRETTELIKQHQERLIALWAEICRAFPLPWPGQGGQ